MATCRGRGTENEVLVYAGPTPLPEAPRSVKLTYSGIKVKVQYSRDLTVAMDTATLHNTNAHAFALPAQEFQFRELNTAVKINNYAWPWRCYISKPTRCYAHVICDIIIQNMVPELRHEISNFWLAWQQQSQHVSPEGGRGQKGQWRGVCPGSEGKLNFQSCIFKLLVRVCGFVVFVSYAR